MKAIIAATALLAVSALPAFAADKVCNGEAAVIRVSTLKGTRAPFEKAVTDQIAWYKAKGITTNRIVTANVINMASGKPVVSTTEVMTIHYNPPGATGTQPAADDAYKAFVKEFRDSSDIAVEKTVCLPK